ncbi:unnamed protein product [Ophioblennius macclurei]
MEEGGGLGVDVVFPEEGTEWTKTPYCPHGPTLLFEKVCKGGHRSRRFFACSACRDRKDCSFFQWEDDKVSEARLLAREAENQAKKRPMTAQQDSWPRFLKFCGLGLHEKRFCADCQLLLLPTEVAAHSSHATSLVSPAQLRRPSLLLRPLDNKKSQAQYLFTERSARFLLDALVAQGYRKLLCVGTPRLQELVKLQNLEQKQAMKSLLLDIDSRYAQFYSRDEFCHYNMFNHHFFGGEASSNVLKNFLTEGGGEKVVMVADPPFGGLVKPLAHSFSLISQMWSKLKSPDSSNTVMPMIWIFPYFFEPRILECLPSLVMLDYQVDYDNHPLYKHGKTGRKQSPVRLFTNIPAKDVILPKEEGYRFCCVCDRYVCSLNKHCIKCNLCPSKDGREWKHCSACDKCVKPSWKHCQSCGRCTLPDHPCGSAHTEQGCFTCSSLQHKHRACPVRKNRLPAKGQSVSKKRPLKSGAPHKNRK